MFGRINARFFFFCIVNVSNTEEKQRFFEVNFFWNVKNSLRLIAKSYVKLFDFRFLFVLFCFDFYNFRLTLNFRKISKLTRCLHFIEMFKIWSVYIFYIFSARFHDKLLFIVSQMSRHLTLQQRNVVSMFAYTLSYIYIYLLYTIYILYACDCMPFYFLLFLFGENFTFCFPAYFCETLMCMWLQARWIFTPTRRQSATMYLYIYI